MDATSPYYYGGRQYYPMGVPGVQRIEQFSLKGRPVSSFEEVRATSIDFDGTIFYFPNLANGRIYTKQINMDGTCTVNMYEQKPLPINQPLSSQQYITREEFEQTIRLLQEKGFFNNPVSNLQNTQIQQTPMNNNQQTQNTDTSTIQNMLEQNKNNSIQQQQQQTMNF